MKTILPRLIDDQTRTQRQCIYLVLIFIGVLVCFYVCGIVFRYVIARKEMAALKKEMKELVSSLAEENINPSNDLEVVLSKLKEISELLKLKESFIKKDVDFTCRTRKKEYHDKAKEIAAQCTSSIEKLTDERQQLAKLLQSGNENKSILEKLANSQETRELVDKVRNNADSHYSSLLKVMKESKIFLSPNYHATLVETREFIDNTKKTQASPAWQNLRQTHASHVQWVNNLEETQAIYNKDVQQAEKDYLELKQILYDKDSLLKQLNDGKDKCASQLETARRWHHDKLPQVEAELLQCHIKANDACNKINSLETAHGKNYVEVSKVTDAYNNFNLLRTWQKESLENCRDNNSAISELRGEVNNLYSSLVKNLDDLDKKTLGTEEFINVYETSYSSISDLDCNLNKIEERIRAEDKFLKEKSLQIKKSEQYIVSLLNEIEASLPNWSAEARKLQGEFAEIQSKVTSIKEDTNSLMKTIKDYRERHTDGYSHLDSLNNKMNIILDHLEMVLKNIVPTEEIRCSNGVELSELLKKRDDARKLLESVPYKPQKITNEISSLIKQGTIYKITYKQNACSFSGELQKGISYFDLALNIPSDGYHYVELRLIKKVGSIYKHQKKHIIEMKCSISQGKTVQMSLNDLTKIQFSTKSDIILEGNVLKGIYPIKLKLEFIPKGKKGTILDKGNWQFNNLNVELLVDGKEATVLWAIPETSYPN